jgi:hypothetical protein
MAPKKATGAASSSEPKSYKPGDIVLGRLKGYPKWRESVCSVCGRCRGRSAGGLVA